MPCLQADDPANQTGPGLGEQPWLPEAEQELSSQNDRLGPQGLLGK